MRSVASSGGSNRIQRRRSRSGSPTSNAAWSRALNCKKKSSASLYGICWNAATRSSSDSVFQESSVKVEVPAPSLISSAADRALGIIEVLERISEVMDVEATKRHKIHKSLRMPHNL